nr:MAG TPA: distal tail protein [Caudoviricetes sp.]
MQGITFGDKHTFDDWGLCLVEDPFVDAADPNLNLLEIDGGNGYINLTEVMTGEPTYQSRKKTWKFKTDARRDDWTGIMRDIAKSVHGQYLEIRLDEQPNGYYEGVCYVDSHTVKDKVLYLNISATLQPFWYENEYTTFDETWSTTDERVVSFKGVPSPNQRTTDTDLRFGNTNFPELDLSQYDSLRIWYDVPRGGKLWNRQFDVTIAGAVGGAFIKFYTVPSSVSHRWFVDIPVSEIKESVEDLSKIWRVQTGSLSGMYCQGVISGHFIQCAGGAVSVNPVIQSSKAGIVVAGNVSESYKSGTYECADIKIPPEGTELCFKNTSASVTVTYRKAWL